MAKPVIGITGGAGYLGSALARDLQPHYQVVLFDNKAPANTSPSVTYIPCDITDAAQVKSGIKHIDVLFHRVGLMGNGASMLAPELYYKVNVQGTMNVLQACVESGVKRFVFDSTEAVYGGMVRSPVSEDQLAKPASIYGATKLICEQAISLFDRKWGLSTLIFRYCRIREAKKHDAIAILARKVLKNEPITLYDGGAPIIDFVELSDVISANALAIQSAVRNEVINISSGEGISFSGIVRTIEELTDRKAGNVAFEYPPRMPPCSEFQYGPNEFFMSVEKARRLLGWKPSTSIRDSIRKTVEYIRQEEQ